MTISLSFTDINIGNDILHDYDTSMTMRLSDLPAYDCMPIVTVRGVIIIVQVRCRERVTVMLHSRVES